MPTYTITPQDILFFRDGRPMTADAGSGGHGARWPEPSILFDALHAALHRAFPAKTREEFQTWEHSHFYGRNGRRPERSDNSKRMQRFGSLVTAGPFPVFNGSWYFPCPADVNRRLTTSPALHPLKGKRGASDLPPPAIHPVVSLLEPDKEGPHPWWNKHAIEKYLGAKTTGGPQHLPEEEFFGSEWNTGIAIDPATQTTGHGGAKGQIYSAQYLRLREGVALGLHAQMPTKVGNAESFLEALKHLFPANRVLICGGQQRACKVEEASENRLDRFMPRSVEVKGQRVKWMLLTPAVYPTITATDNEGQLKQDHDGRNLSAHPGGWLPSWIDPSTGRVLLKKGDTRRSTPSREAWRKQIQTLAAFDCRLVAARIPKPIILTGWSERLHLLGDPLEQNADRKSKGARGTCLAVPAGAVYYFEGPDAPALAHALSWHGSAQENPACDRIVNRRSALLGEKGFGLGVCGAWEFFEDTAGRSAS